MASYKMSIIWVCSAVLLIGWVLTQDQALWSTTETSHSCNWTCMLFTLQWPGSFCLNINNKNICRIPENIQDWTIHGLWPLKDHYCCSCWPIFHSHLQELEPEISQLWPSLIKTRSNFTFWKEEWFKHGTCAGCVDNMSSPFLYFKTVLQLRLLFDVDTVLAKADIKPSCNVSYKYDELHGALEPLLGDNFVLQCVKDEKIPDLNPTEHVWDDLEHRLHPRPPPPTLVADLNNTIVAKRANPHSHAPKSIVEEREAWLQLKILVSKNMTLGCHAAEELKCSKMTNTSSGHPCPTNTTIYYFPINHEHPKEPCIAAYI